MMYYNTPSRDCQPKNEKNLFWVINALEYFDLLALTREYSLSKFVFARGKSGEKGRFRRGMGAGGGRRRMFIEHNIWGADLKRGLTRGNFWEGIT
jgi:hypothetical protein